MSKTIKNALVGRPSRCHNRNELHKPHGFWCEGNIKVTEVPNGKFACYLHKQFPNRNCDLYLFLNDETQPNQWFESSMNFIEIFYYFAKQTVKIQYDLINLFPPSLEPRKVVFHFWNGLFSESWCK